MAVSYVKTCPAVIEIHGYYKMIVHIMRNLHQFRDKFLSFFVKAQRKQFFTSGADLQ